MRHARRLGPLPFRDVGLVALCAITAACAGSSIAPLPLASTEAQTAPLATTAAVTEAPVRPTRLAATPPPAPPALQVTAAPSPSPISASEVRRWFDEARPPRVAGRYAVTDVSAYTGATRKLAEVPPTHPAVTGGSSGSMSYAGLPSPRALLSGTSLVVRGRPLSFSRPYFNSADGSWWHADLTDRSLGYPGMTYIMRDVLFQVDELVMGELPGGAPPGTIEFAVFGGEAVVTILPDAVEQAEHTHFEPGTFTWSEAPLADMKLGEHVVLFLDHIEADGLYGDDGRSFGYVYKLMPAHPAYSVWRYDGAAATDDKIPGGPYALSMDELRELGADGWLGNSAGGPPDDEVHPTFGPGDGPLGPPPTGRP